MFYLVAICSTTKLLLVTEKRPSTVNKHFQSVQCSCSKPPQDSQSNCLVFVRVEKQRFGDGNFSGGEMILIGQFFAVGSHRPLAFIERAGQFCKAVYCKVTRQLRRQMIWHQDRICTDKFWCYLVAEMFNFIQIHSLKGVLQYGVYHSLSEITYLLCNYFCCLG